MTVIDAATGARLSDADVDAAAGFFAALPPGVVFALMPTEIPAVARYLGALRAGRPIALLDPDLDRTALLDMLDRFRPVLVTGITTAPPDGYLAEGDTWVREGAAAPPHPELALLLTTSGSTGNPKLVRLSRGAIQANAKAIADSLGITAGDVAVTTLPLFYTYGLSVLQSHRLRGATVVLERTGILQRDFWNAITEHGVTSMAAVPYQYEMLRRLRFDPVKYPALRTLTQAGGRLRTE
ncbi:MAG: hypothetical protein QOH97_3857, partial [Actinoplanes sp.]|nr:hypothetical protein [Actinoplanes sp.]